MKVNYLPKNRLKNPHFGKILILVAIFIFGAIAFYFFRGTLISLVSPIWKAKNIIVSGENVTPIIDRQTESGLVVATVLTYPPQTPYDVIIIDAGSNESITIGSQVLLPEGPILGIVSEVFPKSAKVKLFSANGEETNAVLERNNVPVTLVGVGGGNFRLAVPRDIAIEKGDRILSPDITARLLATVGEVSVRPTDSFKEVLAKSPTNIFTLRFVFVTP